MFKFMARLLCVLITLQSCVASNPEPDPARRMVVNAEETSLLMEDDASAPLGPQALNVDEIRKRLDKYAEEDESRCCDCWYKRWCCACCYTPECRLASDRLVMGFVVFTFFIVMVVLISGATRTAN